MNRVFCRISAAVLIILASGCATMPLQPVPPEPSTDIDQCFSLVNQGRYTDAIPICESAVKNNQDSFIAHASYAKALSETGRADEAEAMYRSALAIDPEGVSARMELGILLKDNGNFKGALAEFQAVLDRQPDYFNAVHQKAQVYRLQRQWKKTAETFQIAVTLQPGDQTLRMDLAEALVKAGRARESRNAMQTAIQDFPESIPLLSYYAGLLEDQHMFKSAITQYREILRQDSGNMTAQYRIAQCYYRDGNLTEASRAVQTFIAAYPSASSGYFLAGQIASDREQLSEAERYFRQAIEKDGSYGPAWVMLGNTLQKKGDRPGAREAYRQALRINPDDAIAKRNLKRLY